MSADASANPGEDLEFQESTDACICYLESVVEDRSLLARLSKAQCRALLIAAGRVALPDGQSKRALRRELKRRQEQQLRERDAQLLSETGIRRKRREAVYATPGLAAPPKPGLPVEHPSAGIASMARPEESYRELQMERNCYICKSDYRRLHFFYDALCPACAELNYFKREQTADLAGRKALLTGGRIKIGYQAAIKLLRAGAYVIVTTRFPRDAAKRFTDAEDFDSWGERLEIHGLDLRHTPSVEAFARQLVKTHDRLDFILNNACQTVRKPPGFYSHLMAGETKSLCELPACQRRVLSAFEERRLGGESDVGADLSTLGDGESLAGLRASAALSQVPLVAEDFSEVPHLFPEGRLDADLQQLDLRSINSWRLGLADVPTIELLEVHLVNAVAPFLLCARLKPLMLKQPSVDKHIVNVSAMEGQFYRAFKTDKHPHTNMAKAALNMLTRTSAADYIREGIHINSVDTGWITDEDPQAVADRKAVDQGARFEPPLDIVDAAARICDPVFSAFNSGKHVWGQFLKDYRPTDW